MKYPNARDSAAINPVFPTITAGLMAAKIMSLSVQKF